MDDIDTALTPELLCRDIKSSLAFYVDILGFRIQYDRPEEGFAMLERQGSRIMLDEARLEDNKRSWITGPLEYPFGRGINLQIDTLDATSLYKQSKSSGAVIFLDLEEKWYRTEDKHVGCKQFIVLDPDGYMLRFSEFLGERDTID